MKTLFALITTLLIGNLAYSQGTFVYDQQVVGNPSRGGAFIQNQQPMGQSFTPSLSAIGFVQFEFLDTSGNLGATAYINLLANSITGNVLAATSPVFMPNGFFGITNFFFSSNIPLQSGIEYFFLPVLQSGDNTGLLAGQYNYAGGSAIFSGQPSSGLDFTFREGIVVPEPTMGSILLIGAASATFFRRHQRRHC